VPPIITEAGEAGCGEAVAPQPEHKFGRPHKAPPIMRAARQPAQQVLGADDCQRKRLRGAVQGGADKDPARPDQGAERGEERFAIGDVLDDFERQGDVDTRPLASAWARATSIAEASASIPVTAKPSRVIGSATRPPPQPMSSSRKPSNGRSVRGSRPRDVSSWRRMKSRRAGFIRWSGRKLPSGSHQPALCAAKRSMSSGSTVSPNSVIPSASRARLAAASITEPPGEYAGPAARRQYGAHLAYWPETCDSKATRSGSGRGLRALRSNA